MLAVHSRLPHMLASSWRSCSDTIAVLSFSRQCSLADSAVACTGLQCGLSGSFTPVAHADKGNQAFWEHEWDCHGKCAGVEDGALQTQAAFFSTVLGLDQRYPLDVRSPACLPLVHLAAGFAC